MKREPGYLSVKARGGEIEHLAKSRIHLFDPNYLPPPMATPS